MGTFILLVISILAMVVFFYDPFGRMAKWAKGRTNAELKAEVRQMENEKLVQAGCIGAFAVVFGLLLNFLISPVYVLTAIGSEIGRRDIAYVVLAIILLSWGRVIFDYRKNVRAAAAKKNVTVITDSGKQLTGNIAEDPNAVLLSDDPYTVKRLVTRVFWGIPQFYLIYLLLISLKLIAG